MLQLGLAYSKPNFRIKNTSVGGIEISCRRNLNLDTRVASRSTEQGTTTRDTSQDEFLARIKMKRKKKKKNHRVLEIIFKYLNI